MVLPMPRRRTGERNLPFRRMATHIDQMQIGHRRIAEARMQMDGVIAARTAVDWLSTDGVAETSTTGKSPIRALTTAMSRAL